MTERNRGLRFALTISILAAIYGSILTVRLLSHDTDVLSDAVKFSVLIFVMTFLVSSFWWVIVRKGMAGWKSGAAAGFLTAITIIPLPTLIGSLKAQFAQSVAIDTALASALSYSWSTWSFAEFLAIPLSIIVGVWATKGM